MTIGEQLLNLTVEYAAAVKVREDYPNLGGEPAGRDPQAIATEYEAKLRELYAPVS